MGLLDRMRGRKTVTAFMLPGGRQIEVKGEAQYQQALSAICGGKSPKGHHLQVTAALIPEPSNKWDPNAVQVYVDAALVGYMNRTDAADYAPVLHTMLRKVGATGACSAVIRGGWDRGDGDEGHFGIWLDVASADTLFRL